MPYLRPDCKSQVTVEYENGKPKCVKAVVIAAQNNGSVEDAVLKKQIIEKVIKYVIPANLLVRRRKIRHQRHRQIRHRRNTRRLRLNRQKNHR